MPPEILNLLPEIPIVIVFVWFVLEWTKRNNEAADKRDVNFSELLREQRESNKQVTQELIVEVKRLTECMTEHDRKTDLAIDHFKSREDTQQRRRNPSSKE